MCGCSKKAANPGSAPPTRPPPARTVAPVRPAPPARTVAPVRPAQTPTRSALSNSRPLAALFNRRGGVSPVPAPAPQKVTASGLPIVDTSIWGPPLWKVLHTIAAAADQPAVAALWKSIPSSLDGSLPCPLCQGHYHDWLNSHPVPTEGTGAIARWVLDLHNAVNRRNGLATWTTEQLTAAYPVTSDSLDAVRTALGALQGVIGAAGYVALTAALATVMVPAAPSQEPAPTAAAAQEIPAPE